MEEEQIVVNKEMLRAIGADTRIAILKTLKERQKTQSEIAGELKLSGPTIVEHVGQLEKAGLIELVPQDKERKWKYYRLTIVGRKMVEGSKMNVMVLLSAALLLTLGALYFFFVLAPLSQPQLASAPTGDAQKELTEQPSPQKTILPSPVPSTEPAAVSSAEAAGIAKDKIIREGRFMYDELEFNGYEMSNIYIENGERLVTFCKGICSSENSFSLKEGETKKITDKCLFVKSIAPPQIAMPLYIDATLYYC